MTLALGLEHLRQVEAELARRSFVFFVAQVRPEYDLEWFHLRICHEVQAWAESEQAYHLVLSMPPGHGKSEYAKLALAWLITRDPSMQLAYACYAQSLADTHMGGIQGILESDTYMRLFGRILNPRRAVSDERRGAKRTKDHFEHLHGSGFVKSVGVGGGLSGFRLDVAVCDDLVKDAKVAYSQVNRDTVWDWLTKVVMTRKRPHRQLRMMLIGTRWHLDDATGRLIEAMPDDVKVITFEALRSDMSDQEDPRAAGEALWRAAADEAFLNRYRQVDPEGFEALFQQRPIAAGGNLYDLGWFAHYDALPDVAGTWSTSWDPRGGGAKDAGSYCVAQLWFSPQGVQDQHYLVDQRRERWSPGEALAAFKALMSDDLWGRAKTWYVEGKADGKMLLDMGRSTAHEHKISLVEVRPDKDKVQRARDVQPVVRVGKVFIPRRAAWLGVWKSEVVHFPGAANDDQVDAMTQYLAKRSKTRRPALTKVMLL